MKDRLKEKYVPPYYYDHLLDRWHRIFQGNKSAKKYASEFDEFLNCYNILDKRVTLKSSQFQTWLGVDLQDELWASGITELKRAYALVQDLNVFKLSHVFRNQDHRVPAFKFTSYQCPHHGNVQTPTYKVHTKNKSVESNAKGKNTERDFSTLSPMSSVKIVKVMCILLLTVQEQSEWFSINRL